MPKRNVGEKEAAELYGIVADHQMMESGELRFRLKSRDGSSYIRTESSRKDGLEYFGWQNAHFHRMATETYIVQSGTMILACKKDKTTDYQCFKAGVVVSIAPYVPHNVYLQRGSIIHTVKLFDENGEDWIDHSELDAETKALSEEGAMQKARQHNQIGDIDPRYASYVSIYNNFDNIIWKMPTFLTGGVTLLVGLAMGILGNKEGEASALVWGTVLAASSLIMFLGAYGLWRLRIHQNMIGNELRKMESDGYFRARERARASLFLPRAPAVYIVIFFLLSAGLALTSASVFNKNAKVLGILNITE